MEKQNETTKGQMAIPCETVQEKTTAKKTPKKKKPVSKETLFCAVDKLKDAINLFAEDNNTSTLRVRDFKGTLNVLEAKIKKL